MGNSQKKIRKQLSLANSLVSDPRFKELTGLSLLFTLLKRNSTEIPDKKKNKKFEILISFISSDYSVTSEIGTVTPENLKKVYNIIQHLISLTASTDVGEESLCSICLENRADTILECSHQFCLSDLQIWELKNKECPLCRVSFTLKNSFVKLEGSFENISEEVKICKEEILKLVDYSI